MAHTDRESPAISLTDSYSLGAGFVAGISAYVLGYLLTYLFASGSIRRSLSAPFDLGLDVPTTTVVGWLYYGMHQVRLVVTASGGGRTPSGAVAISEFGFWEGWYALVPPVLLVLVGLGVARTLAVADLKTGTLAGASLAVGYLPPAVLGIFVFEYTRSAAGVSVSVGPDLATGVVFVGLVYPLVFGGIGGAIGAWAGS